MTDFVRDRKPIIFLCPSANGSFWWAKANPNAVGCMSLHDEWLLSCARDWCGIKNLAEGRPPTPNPVIGYRKPVLSLQESDTCLRWTSRYHNPNYATSHVERDMLLRGARWCHLRNQQERRIY